MTSLANFFSRMPLSLSTIGTGLMVAQSMRISFGLSAASTAALGNRPNSRVDAKTARREARIIAISHRRYIYSLESQMIGVNKKLLLNYRMDIESYSDR